MFISDLPPYLDYYMHVNWVILVNNEKKDLLAIVFNGQTQSYVKITKLTKTVNWKKKWPWQNSYNEWRQY